jgi:hypothetical protein
MNLLKFLFPDSINLPNTRWSPTEDLYAAGLPMGGVILGKQGSGKTTSLARFLVQYALDHPDEPIACFDISQSVTDDFMKIVLSLPKEQKDALLKRMIYDELGNTEWVLPLPEFHSSYGVGMEKQIQRVAQNLGKCSPELGEQTPIMGGIPLKHYAPEVFRLLTVMMNEFGESWQITEAKHLLINRTLLKNALNKYGYLAPSAKWLLENQYLNLKPDEAMKRVMALISVLEDIEAPEIRARVGYPRPAYTAKDIIEKGKILFVNGRLINDQDRTVQYIFTQVYSMFMNEIQMRTPHDPMDKPVTLVFDEVYQMIGMKSFAPELSRLSTYFRSRKLNPIIVAQELSQFSDELRPHIWSYGNIITFSVFNFDDAFELAQQLFPYYPQSIKMPSRTDTGQPITEPDRGQYLQIANKIRGMKHRECLVRSYISEREPEKYIRWVPKTKDVAMTATDSEVAELKQELLEKYGVRIRDALTVINQRMRPNRENPTPPTLGG